MRAAMGDRVAGDDQRALGRGEERRRRLQRRAVAAHAWGDAARPPEIEIRLGVEDIGRKRQEDRAGRWSQRGLGGAMHHARQIREAMHLGRPLHERARHRREVGPENRLGDVEALIVLARGDENRGCGLLGVVEHAHGVAEAGRDMQVHGCKPARGLGIAVGHRHRGRLL